MNNKKLHRRNFISNTVKAGLAVTILPSFVGKEKAMVWEPSFKQEPLPYDYKALEPNIDALTMEIHYTKHAAAYAKNLNEAYKAEYKKAGLQELKTLLGEISTYSIKMRNNAGGHYNHELFWHCLTPKSSLKPSGKLAAAIDKNFTSFDEFKKQFSDAAKSRFGSGWAWLILQKDGSLKITSTPNQDNPLMDVAEIKGFPLLGLDVWEHAYYLKYQNKRADYINSFWNIVNWDFVQERFEANF